MFVCANIHEYAMKWIIFFGKVLKLSLYLANSGRRLFLLTEKIAKFRLHYFQIELVQVYCDYVNIRISFFYAAFIDTAFVS